VLCGSAKHFTEIASLTVSPSSRAEWKRDVVRRYKADLSVLRSPSVPTSNSSKKEDGEGYSAPALMRTASVNGLIVTKSHSLDRADPTPWTASFQAIVPYLGCHTAELLTINDGNSDFLVDRPYLFNMHKLALLAGTLSMLHKMQQLRYNLAPVRTIAAALNFAAKRHLKLTPAAASERSRQWFALSHAVEPVNMVPGDSERGSAAGAGHGLGDKARTAAAAGMKGRSSGAYNRLTGRAAGEEGEEGNSEEEGSEGEEDEEEGSEEVRPRGRGRKLLTRPFKLIRTLTSAFMSAGSK
jgi:hypothetical protein